MFLLSATEAEEFLSIKSARLCKGTLYCFAQGAYKVNDGICWWWLRSRGMHPEYAAYVNNDGSISQTGFNVDITSVAVRPAMWIDLSADN